MNITDLYTETAIRTAWKKVRRNKGASGIDNITLHDYQLQLHHNLQQLRQSILDNTYQPQPIQSVHIEKNDGSYRSLAILTINDRIAQTVISNWLTPIIEADFSPASYAYRKNHSVQQALQHISKLINQGNKWVLRADIKTYFDTIPHQPLLDKLKPYISDQNILQLIQQWLSVPLIEGTQQTHLQQGVPQGSPLSPLLSNLYLNDFDHQLQENYQLIRYADDFLILTQSETQAQHAKQQVEQILDSLHLTLNHEKTTISHINQGFFFLGQSFIENTPTNPQTPENSDTTEVPENNSPRLKTLYILEDGAILKKKYERFVIKKKGTILQEIPLIHVQQILIFGNTQITTQAMHFCLKRNIPIYLLSGKGKYFGMIDSFSTDHIELQHAQFTKANNPAFCIELAAGIIKGKIANSRIILQRLKRHHNAPELQQTIDQLKHSINKLDNAINLDQVRGIEGSAARSYFQAIASTLDPTWKFNSRNRRPPKDPFNALLSYGYTLLYYNTYSFLRSKGLNPHIGYLHPMRRGHPALASDLMEEFRAIIVDSAILSLIRNKRLTPEDFEYTESHACQLKSSARKCFIQQLENKFNTTVTHPNTGLKIDFRRCIEHQAQHLSRHIRDKEPDYQPIIFR